MLLVLFVDIYDCVFVCLIHVCAWFVLVGFDLFFFLPAYLFMCVWSVTLNLKHFDIQLSLVTTVTPIRSSHKSSQRHLQTSTSTVIAVFRIPSCFKHVVFLRSYYLGAWEDVVHSARGRSGLQQQNHLGWRRSDLSMRFRPLVLFWTHRPVADSSWSLAKSWCFLCNNKLTATWNDA